MGREENAEEQQSGDLRARLTRFELVQVNVLCVNDNLKPGSGCGVKLLKRTLLS